MQSLRRTIRRYDAFHRLVNSVLAYVRISTVSPAATLGSTEKGMSSAEMRTAWHRTAATCYLLNEESKRAPKYAGGDIDIDFLKSKSLGDGWHTVNSHYFMDKKLDFHFHVETEADSMVEVALGSDKSFQSSDWQTIDPPSFSALQEEETVVDKVASDVSSVNWKVGVAKKTSVACRVLDDPNKQQPASKSVDMISGQNVPQWRHANKGELAALIARKSSEDMGNCDLPPPLSPAARSMEDVFERKRSAEESTTSHSLDSKTRRTFVSSKHSAHPSRSTCTASDDSRESSASVNWKGHEGDSGFLGEALCRSQTRAREAEKLAAEAISEKEQVLKLFFREASVSLAYKYWIKFLETENSWLRRRQQPDMYTEREEEQDDEHSKQHNSKAKKKRKHLNSEHTAAVLGCTVGLAFALGVSLAGAGLVFGCTMGWILFAF